MALDLRTLTVVAMLITVLMAVAMFVLWRPSRDASLKVWMIGSASLAVGFLLIALRGIIPDVVSIAGGNGLIAIGAGCIWMSIDVFFGRRTQWLPLMLVAALVVISFTYFTVIAPNITVRIVLNSIVSGSFPLLAVWRLVNERVPSEIAPARTFMAIALFCHSLYSLTRIVLTLSGPPSPSDFMAANLTHSSSMIDGIITAFVQTFGLTALVQGRNQRQLSDAKLLADRSNAAKSQFIASMSHEIRTPLNAIIGYGQLLASASLAATEKTRATRLLAAGRLLLRLIDDILDFSKFQASDVSIYVTPVDIRAAIHNQADVVRLDVQERGLTFDVVIDDDVPPTAVFDGERFQQVLLNLLTNAAKFTQSGGIVLKCSIDSRTQGDAIVVLRVTDSGVGMTDEELSGIFEPFARINELNVPGTGLGLTIVRTIVRAMRGDITLTSEKGRGTTAILRFPVTIPAHSQAEAPTTPPPHYTRAARVLIAEDEPRNAEIIEAFLTIAGMTPVLVRDGQAAVEAVQHGPFSAILMDVEMPVMNGLDATRAIRALPSPERARTPIVALTAYASQEDRERCFGAGVNHFLTKPINREELLRVLAKYVGLDSNVSDARVQNANMQGTIDTAHLESLKLAMPNGRLAAFLRESLAASEAHVRVIMDAGESTASKAKACHQLVSVFGNIGLTGLSVGCRALQETFLADQPLAEGDADALNAGIAQGRLAVEAYLREF